MKIIFVILVFVITACSVTGENKTSIINPAVKNSIPISLRFLGTTPPDSISDFIKVYLQSRGYNVVGPQESLDLFLGEMQSKAPEIIRLTGESLTKEELAKKIMEKYDVVCRLLMFKTTNNSLGNEYSLDSLMWRTFALPPKDSSVYHVYTATNRSGNIYENLKQFLNIIIDSGLINK